MVSARLKALLWVLMIISLTETIGVSVNTMNLASVDSIGVETMNLPSFCVTGMSATAPFSGLSRAAYLPPSLKLRSTSLSSPEKFLTQ